jgi:pimeloyl-ACP methyl ester carboxylesterase
VTVALAVAAVAASGLPACSATSGELARAGSAPRPAASDPGDEGTARDPGDAAASVDWGRCADDAARLAELACGTIEVPLDPADPEGDTIELVLARAAATGGGERLGSIVMNPGGPGGSGIEALATVVTAFPEELRRRFDLVSWDPRGVGESTPVRCLDDTAKEEQIQGDLSPDTPEELERAVADQEAVRIACQERNPDLVTHMSTADVAADLDRIREAVGDERLTYVGFSYGTRIGAAYATLFPDRVRALVLDGAVSTEADDAEVGAQQAQGFEQTFAGFAAACDADAACALSGGAADRVRAVQARLEAEPVTVDTASGNRELGRDLFTIGFGTALYQPDIWGIVADAVARIDSGGGAVLLSLADQQLGRNRDGTWDNSSDAQAMVGCADTPRRPTVEEAIADGRRIAAASPTFGDTFGSGVVGCIGWPLPDNPLPALTGKGAPPVMVIGTVGDPATPYAWAEEMARSLESATLLTYEGQGHTAFLRGGPCIDGAVTRYLVDLDVPEAGTRCPASDDDSGSVEFLGARDFLADQLEQAGVSPEVAECVLAALDEELGPGGLDTLILDDDVEAQTELFTRITLRCMTGG